MFESNPIYYRVLGIGESTTDTITKINALGKPGVSAKVLADGEMPTPTKDDQLAIVIVDGEAEKAKAVVNVFSEVDTLTAVITTGNEIYNGSSTAHVERQEMFSTAKAILDILFNQQVISLDFTDFFRTLDGTSCFRVIEETGHTKGARVKDAIDKIAARFRATKDKNLIFTIYCNENAKSGLKMDEMAALTEFISKLPSDIDVIWGFGYDPSIKDDSVRVILLAAGDE